MLFAGKLQLLSLPNSKRPFRTPAIELKNSSTTRPVGQLMNLVVARHMSLTFSNSSGSNVTLASRCPWPLSIFFLSPNDSLPIRLDGSGMESWMSWVNLLCVGHVPFQSPSLLFALWAGLTQRGWVVKMLQYVGGRYAGRVAVVKDSA
jgi:hypothetical protein